MLALMLLRDPLIIQTVGSTKHIIRGKFNFIKFNNGNIEISEALYPLILKSYMTCDFVFTGLPIDITSINMLIEDKILETVNNNNGVVRFKTFAYSVSEDPLISICLKKNSIKFTYETKRKLDKKSALETSLLFDSLSLSKSLYNIINTNIYVSKLPCCPLSITYDNGSASF